MDKRQTSDRLVYMSTPTELELCLTRRCNQRCVHCNVSAVSEKREEKLDIGFWDDLLCQAVEERVLRVTLTGGEPFVRNEINDLLRSLASKPLGTIILTNGTTITDEQMDIILSGTGSITLSISLDGTSDEQHDKFRRSPGAFERTLQVMHRLTKRGVRFVISSVIQAENVNDAEKFLDITRAVGAARLIIVPIAKVGRARSTYAQKFYPSSKSVAEALSKSEASRTWNSRC